MRALFITILLPLLLLQPAQAQQSAEPATRPDASSLSEQMTAAQFSHIKLWFAGKLGNWKLATYELDLLASRLDEATKRAPGVSAEDIAGQIASVRNAIDVKNLPAFMKAYSELTNACNACHRAAGREFISVQVPVASPFTDQDFADQVIEGRRLAHTICGVCHVVPDKPNAPLAMSFSAPSFVDLARRPSFTETTLRQLLTSEHRRIGPTQAMPNPRLNDSQIDDIVAYFEVLKGEQRKSP